ncbi:MAG: GWxTD domain-containing protein [Candidatus Aminicenantes bacterium]|nr:GWxTD domain-containing protein [Candidatus Aminicenantes bacterium]
MSKNISMISAALMLTIALVTVSGVSCGGTKKLKLETGAWDDAFLETARFIMLKDEARIYKHLPDNEAREAFIKEFWEKRDPNPETPENEAKMEFDRRVEFINRWFNESTGKGRGWNSDRGKVFLYLGAPDARDVHERTIYDSFGMAMRVQAETWIYNRHMLALEFIDRGFGIFRLTSWPPDLLSAIESEKFTIFENKQAAQKFKFKASCENGEIKISIPVKDITFDEDNANMKAKFNILIYVYYDYKKIAKKEETRDMSWPKDELLKKNTLELSVPYTPALKGKYYFDIIVRDAISTSSYRNLIQHKF